MDWLTTQGNISIWVMVLPVVLGCFFFNKLDFDSKLILGVVLIGFCIQLLHYVLHQKVVLNWLYNIYTPIEFVALWYLFKKKLLSLQRRNFMDISLLVFAVISIGLVLTFGLNQRYLYEWAIVKNIVLIYWVALCLFEFYFTSYLKINIQQPFYWYLSGIICYASCTLVFYLMWYLVRKYATQDFSGLALCHLVFNTILYLLFAVGLFKNYQHPTPFRF